MFLNLAQNELTEFLTDNDIIITVTDKSNLIIYHLKFKFVTLQFCGTLQPEAHK